MKEIELSKGMVAIVDDCDFDELSRFNWYLGTTSVVYAIRNIYLPDGKRRTLGMHRQIMQMAGFDIAGREVDHRDGNGLDNRRENLRLASHADNMRNKGVSCNNTSGFKGIYRVKEGSSWAASIKSAGKACYLGRFNSSVEAARAYDRAAIVLFGEFARLNFPEDREHLLLLGLKPCDVLYKRKKPQSGFYGVRKNNSPFNPWTAAATMGGTLEHIGSYPTAEAAARAYDEIAFHERGAKALLNFPEEFDLLA